jgi:hypothetical protein
MLRLLRPLSISPVQFLYLHRNLVLENLAPRLQLSVLRRRHPQPRFAAPDRFFWVKLRRLWAGWRRVVFNNGSLGFIELERKSCGSLDFGTEFTNPNFAAMAESVGIRGIRLRMRQMPSRV